MAQILKEEIRVNILDAALEVFYEKDFLNASIREIAKKAHITPGLIYTYYENKEKLFEAVVNPVLIDWKNTVLSVSNDRKADSIHENEIEFIVNLFEYRRQFIILLDKSEGTPFETEKSKIIGLIEKHLSIVWQQNGRKFDSTFVHIMSSSFIEGILEIMRHYKNNSWAKEILKELAHVFFGYS